MKPRPPLYLLMIILGAAAALALVHPLAGRAETLQELQQRISELNKKTTELEAQSAKYKNLAQTARGEVQSLQNTVSVLNNRIAALEVEINRTETKIQTTKYQIQLTELETQKTEEEISRQRLNLADVLRLLQAREATSLFEIMFLSDSLSSFVNESDQVRTLQARLKQYVDNLKGQKQSLNDQSTALQSAKTDLENFRGELNVQQDALAGERQEKNTLLKKTKGQERAYQQLLSDVDRQESELFKEIRALEQRVEAQKNFLKYAESKTAPPRGTKIFIWPEAGGSITQGYGLTAYAKRGHYGGQIHNGVDISAGSGTPIAAAADGAVFAAGKNQGWGNWVAIEHSNGLVTLYAHMIRSAVVNVGEAVTAGTVIGYEGRTGFTTGPHVHFSVYQKFFTFYKGSEIYFNYDGTLSPLDYM